MQRWFPNTLPDYAGKLNLNNEIIRQLVKEKVDEIYKHQKLDRRNCDGGIYVGVGGVAYMFWKLATSTVFKEKSAEYIQLAEHYFNPTLVYASKINPATDLINYVAFLLGNTGIYATGALIGHAANNETLVNEMVKKFAKAATHLMPVNFLSCGGDELLVGRAGYLSGVLALRQYLNIDIVSDVDVKKIFDSMLTSGRNYARSHQSKSPLMYSYYKTEYLGAAHGLSSILQMMLCFPKCYESDENAQRDIKGAVDYMLDLQQSNGNFPTAVDEINRRPSENELIHWCHGAPGVVYLMAKAWLIWKDERYLQACLKCGELIWKQGLLRKGPGICHGVAGNGYTFLLLYRLTKDPKHLHRAFMFAQFLNTSEFKKNARTPDSPCSLYEGLAGTVCFLVDLLDPDKAHFPLFDIFVA
ncbi:LanC-like protein 3 [Chamberlinius hualienensis]